MKRIKPEKYNLPPRTVLEGGPLQSMAIIIDRKSRIIMKDARRILKMAENINRSNDYKKVSVKTSAPVCSKTRRLLAENQINIEDL